jgi:hypothetical protein
MSDTGITKAQAGKLISQNEDLLKMLSSIDYNLQLLGNCVSQPSPSSPEPFYLRIDQMSC